MTSTIKLFNKIELPAASNSGGASTADIVSFNMEVAYFGYTLTPALMMALASLSRKDFDTVRDTLLEDIAEIKGANKTYRRLFNDFPYSTPDQHEYMEKRILGQMSNDFGISLGGNRLTALGCGHIIDSALFDIDQFGACPICQHAVEELSSPDVAKFEYRTVTPLTAIDYTRDGFRTEGGRMMARAGSLSQDEKTFLTGLVEKGVELSFTDKIFKETLPFAYTLCGADAVKSSISGATDIMRIAYYVSNKDADLSLKENVKFRLSTADKRSLLELLEGTDNLAEDMLRHRERWIRLGERLKPGSEKNRKRYPKVAAAFDRLRNDPKSIVTFNRQLEESVRAQVIDQSLIDLLTERPGEFARRIDFLLRETTDTDMVVAGFAKVVDRLTDILMLNLRKYLASRDMMKNRIFIPKGATNKMQVVEDKRKPIPTEAATKVIAVIDAELQRRYAEKEDLGKVFIDPALKDILLPFNRRGDSSSSTGEIQKGSRYPFNGDILRMFVWWKNGTHGRVDVDLSAVYMDKDFNEVGHVAYTNLRGGGDAIVHSGDIQDAPGEKGASEFIDIDLKKLKTNTNARYLAISVYSFTGQSFDTFPCSAGFMERDNMRSGKVFEPGSVRFRYELNSKNTRTIPLLFDIVERKVVFADLSGGSSRYGSVMNHGDKHKALTEAVMSYPERKPTLFDVAFLNASARGTIVDSADEADVVFNLDDTQSLLEEVGLA